VRRDLQALGVLGSPGSVDALFSIDPATMTDEQLDAAIALLGRRQAEWDGAGAEPRSEIDLIELEAPASD
jgi:hypothetical protein